MSDAYENYLSSKPDVFHNLSDSTEPVPALHHYTTFLGLKGILDTKQIWASDINYLNDSTEFLHAYEIARFVVDALIPTNVGLTAEALKIVRQSLSARNAPNIFIASFAQQPDVLSQWRGYSGSGGVSITFTFENLLQIARKSGFVLRKCVYESSQKHLITKHILRYSIIEACKTAKFNPDQYANNFINLFYTFAAAFKNDAFAEEREWRLISTVLPGNTKNINFRATASMLVPYFELPIAIFDDRDGKSDFGIRGITIGPNNNMNIAMNAVGTMFLRKNLYWRTISPSAAPYRTSI